MSGFVLILTTGTDFERKYKTYCAGDLAIRRLEKTSNVSKTYMYIKTGLFGIVRSFRSPGEGIGYPLGYSWASLVAGW